MKNLTIVFTVWAMILTMSPVVHGRPWYTSLDTATVSSPACYGYHVVRKEAEGRAIFTVSIDPATVVAMEKCAVTTPLQTESEVELKIVEDAGTKQISFSIPLDLLKGAELRVDSAPVKYCLPRLTSNFAGYRLRLDNIPIATEGGFAFAPTVRVLKEAFEFAYILPAKQKPWSQLPPLIDRSYISSLSLQSPMGSPLVVPMPYRNDSLSSENEEIKFVLPADQLANFVLVVEFSDEGNYTFENQENRKRLFVGLGVLAANAELKDKKEAR